MTTYRCRGCGNRTRFDVTSTTTSRAHHHFTLGGEVTIEDETVTSARVVEVTCRWCGHGRDVVLDDPAPAV